MAKLCMLLLIIFLIYFQKAYATSFIIAGSIVHSEEITSLTIIEHGFIAVLRGRVSLQVLFVH
jgi:hypothetical protein